MCLDEGNQSTPYQPTPLIDNEGKKTAEKVQSISAMPDNESKSHEELRWEDYQSRSEESRLENFQGKSHEELRWEDYQSKSEESRLENFQGKSPEELRWEDYQCNRCIGLAESAVQPNKKIGGENSLLLSTWSNNAVEKPTFSTPNIHNNKVFGTFTGPRPEFSKQLIVTHSEVTLEPTKNCPNCCSELRSTALWVEPQPAQVSAPATTIPMVPSQPSFPCFPEQAKPAQECKVPISKDPLQMNQGITFPTILLDAAKTPSEPSINKISPVLSVADVQLVNMGYVQPAVAANPFGTRRETSPITHFHSKSSLLIQQGVSSMPVISTPTPVKTSSWVTCRHLSRNRIKLPARRPSPMNDNPKVPFFCSHDELPQATKGQSWIIARENPKAWVGNLTRIFSSTNHLESESPVSSDSEGTSVINPGYLYGRDSEDDKAVTESLGMLKIQGKQEQHKQNCRNDIITSQTSKHETPQLPKLQRSDYYTKPSLEELAAKEKANSEFLSHVKDFVVGRYGYGHIKFMGETDVRQLDITSIIKFNHREVLIYPDETTKPPIGKGLNKPAEITLLNIKVITRNSGREYTFEEKSEKFKKMLIQKAKDNGAEFISYDPVAAEWKFSVPHFGCI